MDASDVRRDLEAANLDAARAAEGFVPLHAASVETGGAVVALAGRSRAGKSTLAAAAVLAGYGYVADEITAVSPIDLRVRPFHRPIGLRRGGAEAVGIDYPDSDDGRFDHVYPWEVGTEGERSSGGVLAGIVLVEWGETRDPSLSDVAPARSLLEVTQHTVIPDERLASAFESLDSIVRRVPVARMRYRTTAQGLHLLGETIRRWAP